jgi:hypothetical protein
VSAGVLGAVIRNTENTNSNSAAYINLQSGGSSAGDPYITYGVLSTNAYAMGIDNSSSDSFKLSYNSGASLANLANTNLWTMTTAGESTMPLQPAFNAYQDTSDLNVTGDGTTYVLGDTAIGTALTERFDQGGDFTAGASGGAQFDAPVTGRYQFNYFIELVGLTGGTSTYNLLLVTSNESYTYGDTTANGTNEANGLSVLTDMDSADTCTFEVQASGTGKVVDIFGAASGGGAPRTVVSGFLAC